MRNILSAILVAVWVGGCAIGNTHRYDLGDAELSLESEKTVAVMTADLRPYIRSGEKGPNFVGLQRGGFGNPFDVTTDSGRPLASDMTTSIVEAMKKSGVEAFGVMAPVLATAESARATLLKEEADRFVLFLLREWKADTFFNTGLLHDVTLQVLGGDGSELAAKVLSGKDNLGSAFVPADARVHTEQAFKRKLELLLNDPAVSAALE